MTAPGRCLLVSSLLLLAQPAEGALVYLGFGDSITKSTACPVDCNTNFDEANKGGYVGRLETRLGGGCDVQNHGKGGEKTAQGLTRITGVLNGGGDVLLLMEGTNDITNGVSPESIASNLRSMAQKATDRGIDTVLATTIRRIYSANHGPTKNLADEIRDLAGDIDRDLADPYVPLCPNSDCFATHYWQNEPDIGHIDASGYEIMTDVFEDVIRADPVPGTPDPIGPDDVTGDQPTYEWDDVASANWYRLQVEDPSDVRVVDEYYESGEVCSGGTCSASPSGKLDSGEHRFRVRSRNLFDESGWSNWQTFQVYADVPAKVVADSPSGDFYDLDPISFVYQWQEVELALEYRLQVDDEQGTHVVNEKVDSSVCAGSTCTYQPGTALGAGSYTWRVRGQNPAGNGAYSTALALSVWDAAPGTVTPIYPTGELYDTTPTIRWSPTPGATGYDVEVAELGGGVVAQESFGASVCTETLCEASLATELTPGDHHWVVRASNPLGAGLWSAVTSFTLLLCEAPEDVTLTAQVITGSETFRACGTLTVGSGFVVTATGNVLFHAGQQVVLDDGFEVEPGGVVTILVDL